MKVSNPVPEYEIIAPKEAIISWKNDPVTRQILDIISAEKINSYVRIGEGETLGANCEQNTARGVGYGEGLQFLEDLMELRFVVEDKEDGETEEVSAAVRKLRGNKATRN